jgi:predicted NAD/FAD-binding protein
MVATRKPINSLQKHHFRYEFKYKYTITVSVSIYHCVIRRKLKYIVSDVLFRAIIVLVDAHGTLELFLSTFGIIVGFIS